GEGDAIGEGECVAENHYDLVVGAGGDGTINEVINGIAKKEYRPGLGVIPVGTMNDFARALLIPREVKKAVDIIVNGQTKQLDIGKVNDHYFINIAGGGKLTEDRKSVV